MAVLVLAELRAKDASADALRDFLREALPDTRAFDGCRSIGAYADVDDGRTLMLVESWESRAHQQRYLEWRAETGVLARMAAMEDGPPRVRFFEDIEG